MKKIYPLLTILFCAISLHAQEKLITAPTQLTFNNLEAGTVNNLLDGNKNTDSHSKKGELTDYCYIQIDCNNEITLTEEDDLVVYLQRCGHNESEGHPTALKVERSMDGTNWSSFGDDQNMECHVYFLYRGPYTKEYSTRIHTHETFRYLRFTVTANSGRQHDSQGHRYMGMAEFQIYKIGRNDNYPDNMVDRFHLTTDYFKKIKNYKFENTMGVLDKRNRQEGHGTDIQSWCDWGNWSKDGKWQADIESLKIAGITMPEYTMLTSGHDGGYGYKPDNGQERQPTHVTEHVLYAIPGDAIALYPYYSFTGTVNYEVNFAHWYDYQSGGHVDFTDGNGKKTHMLDFLIDPSGVYTNNDYGFFSGKELGKEYDFIISTPQDYIDCVNTFNTFTSSSQWKAKIEIVNDLDFSDMEVPPLGRKNGSSFFYGTLEGNGHKISNLHMETTANEPFGLIARSGDNAVIRNLIIDSSCSFKGKTYVGALVGQEFYGNGTKIENVQIYATVESEQYAAAVIGNKDDGDSGTIIKNCLIGGSITGQMAAAIANWSTSDMNKFSIEKTISQASINSSDGTNLFVRTLTNKNKKLTDCYGHYVDVTNLPDNLDEIIKTWDSWEQKEGNWVPSTIDVFLLNDSKYGKVATFFCPRSPYSPGGELQNLPFRDGENEFVIAADFSQSFSHNINFDHDGQNIIEPIIQFRHVFRIRDGKEFANDFSGSPEANKRYAQQNLRRVSARANAKFQIRLDSPIPQKGTTRSKYYYKISETDYRRVCTMDFDVIDLKTGEIIQKSVVQPDGSIQETLNGSMRFYYGEEFNGEGSRSIDGITYNICGGGGKYYRMIKCDTPLVGHYLIRIKGNDINGNLIKVYDPATDKPSDSDLIVMEMELTILPETVACMVDDETLYKTEENPYAYAQEENLEKAYGEPKQRLTFDEYAAFENLSNIKQYLHGSNHRYYLKWPMPWNEVTYSFDYNEGRNYNMYRVASHSSMGTYNSADLYDRLYYKTKRLGAEQKYGYFFYVNASADPGVMAKLRLQELCKGSTIHVSAWVAEFSTGKEKANISFNFVAVKKDSKDRVNLHSFISGYVPTYNKWYNIYYSFVPDFSNAGIDPSEIDHYELELDNNCKDSESADYAVDNIRLYVASPQIYALQSDPICDDHISELNVTVESPFDVLLQVVGETEASSKTEGKTKQVYYSFIDKEKFDKKYAELKESDDPDAGKTAYSESVLNYHYDGNIENPETTFGKVSFNTCFTANEEYDSSNREISPVAWRKEDNGTRLIVLNTRPEDKSQLSSGKEYYVSIYIPLTDADEENPGWDQFDINNQCAKVAVFRVKPSSTIKIDGEVRENSGDIICCANQSPVIQVNLYEINDDGTISESPLEKNARMDWYNGSITEFRKMKFPDTDDGTPLTDILTYFREAYPDVDNCDVEPKAQLTEQMIGYLKELIQPSEASDGTETQSPKLYLSQTSYVFSPLKPSDNEATYHHVVAVPIINSEKIDGKLICAQPTEIRIRVEKVSPQLTHGFSKDIPYPDYMDDVPLRIGLRQLRSVSADRMDMVDSHECRLYVPIRKVVKAAEGTTEMITVGDNPYIYLVQTNDPEYSDLGTVDGDNEDTGLLLSVGKMTELKANVSGTTNNQFVAVFDKESITFKEGYYYRMRFMFEENAKPEGDGYDVCSGQNVFTIKVVPEYQRWSGKENTNWNNDDNWSRVASSDLYINLEDDKTNPDLKGFVSDGTNKNLHSYAPLNFTKVIIPSEETIVSEVDMNREIFPSLILANGEDLIDLSASFSGIEDEYPGKTTKGVFWTKKPSDNNSGQATKDIEFDMVAHSYSNHSIYGNNVGCRPWYANTCEQIHFRPRSEIIGQQNLIYNKAWVDIATTPGRWYTLSTPFKKAYAGDMYLPSVNARQETELFQDMNFDFHNYNRFSPAVFQRGWNRSSAIVYELPANTGGTGTSRNVFVKADWSNVFNDVTENYGAGTGFSIKTDVSRVQDQPDEVLFRLPKSDTHFDYYSQDGSITGNNTTINRDDNYRLNDVKTDDQNCNISSTSAVGNRYFLMGNPFMAHLDMQKFLEANSDKINKKYWILTESSQKVAVFDENSNGFIGSDNPGKIAPMQGFFVEAKDNQATDDADGKNCTLTLNYNASMACTASFEASRSPLRDASTRSVSSRDEVVISAIRDGKTVSQAFINLSTQADKEYNETDDAILIDNSQLDIPASVYTIAGNMAVSVNSTNDADGMEIGLVTDDDEKTLIVFDGVAPLGDLCLFDTVTGRSMRLYDGMEYEVTGSVTGRLFLSSGNSSVDEIYDSITVSLSNGHVRITSASGNSLTAKVYAADGMLVKNIAGNSSVIEFDLSKGVYILDATDGVKNLKRKIMF